VSANSRSKAISLGIEKGTSAESDGWGEGQPGVKIMGREVRVMKRWGYHWRDAKDSIKNEDIKEEAIDSQETVKDGANPFDEEPALWGLDLEALRSSKGPLVSSGGSNDGAGLPIYTPQSARGYLIKSFASVPQADHVEPKIQLGAENHHWNRGATAEVGS